MYARAGLDARGIVARVFEALGREVVAVGTGALRA
jgi:hypothetical protein